MAKTITSPGMVMSVPRIDACSSSPTVQDSPLARVSPMPVIACLLSLVFSLTPWASPSWAAVRSELVTYKQGDAELKGFLAWDDAVEGRRPAVLLVPEWWGLNDYIRKRAEQVASLGYVVLAADIYGNGRSTRDPKEARGLSGSFLKGDRTLLRERASAGLQTLLDNPLADRERVAAMGYCFGGTTVLELARSGAPLGGVVCFHGRLDTPYPGKDRQIRAKVLVLNGADDPNVPLKQIAAFEDEMRSHGVDWQMILYGGAVHSFTNPASGSRPSTGAAYNEKADQRSWEHLKLFFSEIFSARPPGGG
jgi:dienelactone hydrolase